MTALQAHLFADPAPTTTRERQTTGDKETTTTKDAPVLYRCRACERATKHTQLWRETFSRTTVRTSWWNPSVRQRVTDRRITWTDQTGRQHRSEYPPVRNCRRCQRPTGGEAIRGTFSPHKRCDARCMYAKGPNCECNCGGANHGAGHAL